MVAALPCWHEIHPARQGACLSLHLQVPMKAATYCTAAQPLQRVHSTAVKPAPGKGGPPPAAFRARARRVWRGVRARSFPNPLRGRRLRCDSFVHLPRRRPENQGGIGSLPQGADPSDGQGRRDAPTRRIGSAAVNRSCALVPPKQALPRSFGDVEWAARHRAGPRS